MWTRPTSGVYPYLPLATNVPRTFFLWGRGILLKVDKFQYAEIHIIIAVKLVLSLSEYTKIDVGWGFQRSPRAS